MTRRLDLLALALALPACHATYDAPAQSYRNWQDRWIVRLRLPDLGIAPCRKGFIDYDECYMMQPAKRWRGVWVTQFEGERFCPGVTLACAYDGRSRDELSLNRRNFTSRPPVGAEVNREYTLEFIGRRTEYPVAGVPHYVIVVDRLISMKDMGPLPGLPQEDH